MGEVPLYGTLVYGRREGVGSGVGVEGVQRYLAYKKPPPRRTLHEDCA